MIPGLHTVWTTILPLVPLLLTGRFGNPCLERERKPLTLQYLHSNTLLTVPRKVHEHLLLMWICSLGNVNSGNPDATRALCPRVVGSYPFIG